MAIFEIEGADGKVYEIDAPTIEEAVSAFGQFQQPTGGVSVDSKAVSEFEPKLEAAIAGAANGATLGLADEATGVVQGVMQAPGEGTFIGGYREGRDAVRGEHARRKEAAPGAYLGGEITGGLATSLLSAPYATGKNVIGTIGRGIGIGALEGGIWGAGNSDGGDVLWDAGKGAVMGALVGGGAPAAISATKSGYRALSDMIGGAVNLGNTKRANRALAATVRKSGSNLDDITRNVSRAAQEGQPEYRIMDALGITGQRRASGITRSGGDAADELTEYLSKRQLDQADRVGSFVDEGFALNGQTANQTKTALTGARTEAADAAYGAARGNAAPVDVRGVVARIDDRLGPMEGVDIAGDSIDAKLARFRKRLVAGKTPDGVDSIELSDFDRVLGVKQDIQDAQGAAIRAGRNNEARELDKLVKELDGALEASSDMYRTANDGFREASRVIDAVDTGADFARPGSRAADNVGTFRTMTPEQQQSARVGYGDRALAKIENNAAPTANKARPFQSTKVATEADAMAVDPRLFRDRMSRETQMWETQNRALGGSKTADNLQDISGAGQIASDAGGAIRSAANFQFGDAIANAGRMVAPHLTGNNEATRKLIAQALMSADANKALGPALKTDAAEMLRQRILEALTRSTGRAVQN